MITIGACACGVWGTLVDGRCAFCEAAEAHVAVRRVPVNATGRRPIAALLVALVREMEEEGVPDPLGQSLTLGAVGADLCRLAGEPLPILLAAFAPTDPIPLAAFAPTDPIPLAVPIRRGSFADYGAQFPEAATAEGGQRDR